MVNEDCQHTWFMINDELSLRRGDNSGRPNNEEIIKLQLTNGAETPILWSTNKVTVIVNLLPQMDLFTSEAWACRL